MSCGCTIIFLLLVAAMFGVKLERPMAHPRMGKNQSSVEHTDGEAVAEFGPTNDEGWEDNTDPRVNRGPASVSLRSTPKPVLSSRPKEPVVSSAPVVTPSAQPVPAREVPIEAAVVAGPWVGSPGGGGDSGDFGVLEEFGVFGG